LIRRRSQPLNPPAFAGSCRGSWRARIAAWTGRCSTGFGRPECATTVFGGFSSGRGSAEAAAAPAAPQDSIGKTGFDAQGNPAATPARKNLFSWTLSCGSHLRFPTAVEDIR